MQLKQLIPQEFCLKCDVCCRFLQAHSIWAPLFTWSEIKYLVEKQLFPPLLFTGPQEIKKGKALKRKEEEIPPRQINLIRHKDYFICPCFNPTNLKCKIYIYRSFECQLYPFLLTIKNGKFYLAQDKKCPYLHIAEENKIKTYIYYLKEEFNKKEARYFLKQNKGLFQEYPLSDSKLLFPIDI